MPSLLIIAAAVVASASPLITLGFAGHHVLDGKHREIACEIAGHVAFGDDPTEPALAINHPHTAEALVGQGLDCIRHGRAEGNQRHAITCMHDVRAHA